MSNQNFVTDRPSLFDDTMSDKNAELMKELFDRLTINSATEEQAKLVKEYTDYRNFMSYDIIITDKHGARSKLSDISREKSGGETQTPFYVVIAASFDQIVRISSRQRNSCCLVMFDEAFNNMDESRIQSMVQYFNNLSIQPVIVSPTNRSRSIIPYVQTIIPLTKSRNRIIPLPWKEIDE